MARPIAILAVLSLVALAPARAHSPQDPQAVDRAHRADRAGPGFPEPVDILGVRLALTNLGASVAVRPADGPGDAEPNTTRSVSVGGTCTPLVPTAPDTADTTAHAGATAVLAARITRLVGDDREQSLSGTAAQPPTTDPTRERRQLAQALLGNAHTFLNPPAHLLPEQLAALRRPASGFSASARLDALPARIDRLELRVDLVHAAHLEVVSLPLEAMAEHREIAPGVRFLVRAVDAVERGGRPYTRVQLEYFIERVRDDGTAAQTGDDDDDDEGQAPEATPLVAAIAIRDAKGQLVHLVQGLPETETRDQFIASIGDIAISPDAAKAGPLTIDLVVLHGLERRAIDLVVSDLPLAATPTQ